MNDKPVERMPRRKEDAVEIGKLRSVPLLHKFVDVCESSKDMKQCV